MPRPCLEAAGSDALSSGLANRARPWLSSLELLVGLLAAGLLPGLVALLNEISDKLGIFKSMMELTTWHLNQSKIHIIRWMKIRCWGSKRWYLLWFESSEWARWPAGLINSARVSCPLFRNSPFSGDNSPSSCDCFSTVVLTLGSTSSSGLVGLCKGRLEDCFSVPVAWAAIYLDRNINITVLIISLNYPYVWGKWGRLVGAAHVVRIR
jgi:hypothetical protein